MSTPASNQLFDAYFTARDMRGVFCDQGRVQAMLDFEAALARAQARVGLIPSSAVAPIAAACQAQRYDFSALGDAIATAGNSAIPLVKALGKQIAQSDAEAERYVHLGATSQDVMDTGLVLQLRRALALLEADLERLGGTLAAQAQALRDHTVGRSYLVAARHAGDPRHENRRLAGGADPQSATPARTQASVAGAAVRRGVRNPGRPG